MDTSSAMRRFLSFRTIRKVKRVDPNLGNKIERELAGWFHIVLNFIPVYYDTIHKLHEIPYQTTRALYEDNLDQFGHFMNDCLVEKPGHSITTKRIWEAYEVYHQAMGFQTLSRQSVGMYLHKRLGQNSTTLSSMKGFKNIDIDHSFMR